MLLSLSISHRTTGFELLDDLATATRDLTDEELRGDAAGAVVLRTCTRMELYLDVESARVSAAIDRTVALLAAKLGVDAAQLADRIDVTSDRDAVRHLFAVAAGLESLALGEDEIAGQVRRAYETARRGAATTPELDRAFQRAAHVSREVRTAVELGGAGRSLVRFALDLVGHRVEDWRGVRALVVGTGNYAATTISALRALGVREIGVYSATGRAELIAARSGIRAWHDLPAALADADIIITCTRAYRIGPADMPADGASRLIVDLGMPRNVESSVGRLAGIDLLDLELIARHAGLPEFALEDRARTLVTDAACRYEASQAAAPAIVALRRHVFDALEAEISRVRARAGSEAEAELAAESLRHLTSVLLHTPSERARQAAYEGRIEEFEAGLQTVYGIDASDDAHGRRAVRHLAQARRTGPTGAADGPAVAAVG